MYFNHPWFLFGLLAVLIPIIIHLFNFRRYKKLYFSNISFLKNITVQTRKQNKLKHIIVLILRMLAVFAIVIAFAGPVFKKNKDKVLPADALTIVYTDNSFSMMAEGESGRLFEEAITNAHELVNQSARDASFLLLTNELGSTQERLLSKEAAIGEIDNLEITPENQSLNSIVSRAHSIAEEKNLSGYKMYLFSDFQKNSIDFSAIEADSIARIYLVPLTHIQKRNIYIDSCWLSDPVLIANRRITIQVRLKNSADIDFEKIPLKLWINDQQKAVAGVDIAAGGYEIVTLNFTARQTGWHYAKLEIDDFPITFDDQLYFAFKVEKEIGVLEITDTSLSGYLDVFYRSDSLFRYNVMDYQKVQYDDFSKYNLIILNSLPAISTGLIGQIQHFVEIGGNLILIPNSKEKKETENKLLEAFGAGEIDVFDSNESRVVGIKKDDNLFSDAIQKIPENADLPDVFGHFQYDYHVNSGVESLISLLNGDDFLITKKYGKGRLYAFATPFDNAYTNFTSHPLFVPVMYGVAVEGDAYTSLFYTIGAEKKIVLNTLASLSNSDRAFKIKKYNEDYVFIPEQQFINNGLLIDTRENIKTDGFYELIWDDKRQHVFAFNYDRSESKLDFYSKDELLKQIEDEEIVNMQVLSAGNAGYLEMLNTVEKESQLWKLFIIFALLMLLAETMVLRFWK